VPSAASRRLEPRLHVPPPLRPRGRHDASRPSLAQFVLLSVLLHAFFILLFGSPAGGSRQGQALFGALQVTIRGPLMDTGIGLKLDRSPQLTLPGTELLQKRERDPREAPPVPPKPQAPRPPADLEAPREAQVPAAIPLPPVSPVPPAADLMPAPRIEAPRVELPVVPVPAIDWTPRPAAEPVLAPPVEVPRPKRVPLVPAAPITQGTVPAVAPKLEPAVEIAPIAVPAPPAPARPAPVEVPAIPAPALSHTPAPAITPSLAPPVEVTPIRPAAPPVAAPQPAAPSAPATREAAPSRGDSPVFDNRRPAPTAPSAPQGAPRIDLEAARERARQVAREGSGNRALLPFPMPPAPERRTRLEDAIEKARKPDCKDAYKDLGLLAVLPLIANEFGEGNCRW
jgi:hypothetical protein